MSAAKTVLRVKRRRTEDPFQALLVQHSAGKKPRTNDLQEPKESKDEGKCIFKFAGTVGNAGDVNQESLLETLSMQQKLNPEPSFSRQCKISDNQKRFHQNADCISPFRIISNSQITETQSSENSSQETKDVDKNQNIIEIYDIVNDSHLNVITRGETTSNKRKNSTQETDAIICNSVEMIHEKLKISNDSEVEDADYVYDLYYANQRKIDSNNDLLYIQTLDQDILFDFEINGRLDDDDQIYDDDDDDDSNDENNWRNEYPDKEDVYSSDDNENSNSNDDNESCSSLEEEHMCYDYRSSAARMKFDPYYVDESGSYNYEAYDDNDHGYDYDDDDDDIS